MLTAWRANSMIPPRSRMQNVPSQLEGNARTMGGDRRNGDMLALRLNGDGAMIGEANGKRQQTADGDRHRTQSRTPTLWQTSGGGRATIYSPINELSERTSGGIRSPFGRHLVAVPVWAFFPAPQGLGRAAPAGVGALVLGRGLCLRCDEQSLACGRSRRSS